jgi:hypothetical protein
MKKLILCVALMIATLTSCKKEDITCNPTTCGVIANDGITDGCYWLEIENDCSGNKKKFCFDQSVWMSAYVGTNFCVTGVQPW